MNDVINIRIQRPTHTQLIKFQSFLQNSSSNSNFNSTETENNSSLRNASTLMISKTSIRCPPTISQTFFSGIFAISWRRFLKYAIVDEVRIVCLRLYNRIVKLCLATRQWKNKQKTEAHAPAYVAARNKKSNAIS